MVQEKGKYTVITGASSGIGYETAKAFAGRGKNLVIAARRRDNLEMLKKEILKECPNLDVVIRSTDLSVPENAYQFYEGLKETAAHRQALCLSLAAVVKSVDSTT